jgi:4-amino-4-deoxy-L-arabinose transferase-like glycosyltransferase|tara:strand:+ start:1103 stop:2344 length:1242 start_codon:yes stop_codon:yes gene_type:complete
MFLNNYHQSKNKEIYVLILLILFSIVLRIPVILLYGDTSLEHEWQYLVNNLIQHGKLVYETFDSGYLLPNLWMPPLYAHFLYSFSFFGLEDNNYILFILLSQALLASISVAVFYKINKLFFSERVSFYSSLLFSIFPIHVYACGQISSISVQMFLMILFFYFFFRIANKQNFSSIVIFSFLSGLLILLRGEFRIIFVISIFYLCFFFKIPIKKILFIFLITLITVSPYLIRNYVIFGKITVVETSGYNLWKGNHPHALENSRVEGSEMVSENLKRLNDSIPRDKFYRINRNKLYFEEAIKNILEKPLEYFIFFLKKAISFQFIILGSMDPRYWNPLHYLPILMLGATSLIGLILCNKKSYKFNYLILIFFIIIIILSMVSILPRYKLIILPFQIIFTCVLIEYVTKKFSRQIK